MSNLLIVYGTTEGQTAKIAEHIGDRLRRLGCAATVRQALETTPDEPGAYDGAIVGASLHEGRYQRTVREFIERQKDFLGAHPSAFFGVSLAAASRDAAERAEALRIATDFVRAAGWEPQRIASFAGALKYTQYSWLKRALMKHIAGKEGGDTDTSRDFEYTDWAEVDRFVADFASLAAGSARP